MQDDAGYGPGFRRPKLAVHMPIEVLKGVIGTTLARTIQIFVTQNTSPFDI